MSIADGIRLATEWGQDRRARDESEQAARWRDEQQAQQRAEWERQQKARSSADSLMAEGIKRYEAAPQGIDPAFLTQYGLQRQLPQSGYARHQGFEPNMETPKAPAPSPARQRALDDMRAAQGIGGTQGLDFYRSARKQVDDEDRNSQFAQLHNAVLNAPPEKVAAFAKTYSDNSTAPGKLTQGKDGLMTLTLDGGENIPMNRAQVASYITGLYKMRQGDRTGLADIAAVSDKLSAATQNLWGRQKDVASAHNDAAYKANAMTNDNQRTANDGARLGLARKQADAQTKRAEQEDWAPIAVSEDGKGLTVYNRRTHAMRNEPLPEGVDAHGLFAKLTGSRGQQGPVAVPEDGKMFYHPQLGTVTYYAGQAVAKGGVPDAGVQDALKEAKYDVNLVNDAVRQGLLKADPNGRGVIDRDGNTYSYTDKDDAKALNAKLREIATRTLEGEEGRKRHGDSGALERRYPTPPRDTRFAAPGVTPYGLMPPTGYAVDPRRFQGK